MRFIIKNLMVFICIIASLSIRFEPASGYANAVNDRAVASDLLLQEKNKYSAVFADDAVNPHYLFFLGYNKGSAQQMVWKYDIYGDSLLAGYPKNVEDVFGLPYKKRISGITGAGWLYFSDESPKSQLYFFGDGYCYSYSLKSKKAGPLLPVKKLSAQNWPSNLSGSVDCAFYSPKRKANYIFAGRVYEKLSIANRKWSYSKGRIINEVWRGIPSVFQNNGFSGVYYNEASRIAYFFSGDHFIMFNEDKLETIGLAEKISAFYKGL